jgi:colicin import membrane protein
MANNIDFNVNSNAVTVLNQTGAAAANTAQQFTSAKAELRALTQQMLQLDASSAEFKKASARASELKDRMEELGENVRVNIGNSFEQASNSVSLFTGRLMGGDLKGAGDALTNLGGAVSKISFKEIQQEIGGLIKGLKNLAVSVVSNPFFLIAGTLAAIAYNYEEIAKWATQTTQAQQNQAKVTEDLAKATQEEVAKNAEKITQIEVLTNRVKDNNLTEKDRRKALKDLEEMYPAYFSNINGDINDTEALNTAKQKLVANILAEAKANAAKRLLEDAYAKRVTLEMDINAKKANLTQQQMNEALEDARYNSQTLFKETNQAISEWAGGTAGVGQAMLELENANAQIAILEKEATVSVQKGIDDYLDKEREKTEAAATAAQTQREKREEQRQKELENNAVKAAEELKQEQKLAAEKLKVREDYIKANQSAQANELYELEKKRELELQTWEGDEEDKVYIVEKYRLAEIDINTKYDDLALEQQIAANEKLKAEDEKAKEDAKKREEDLAKAKIDAEKQLYEARWSLATASIEVFSSLFAKNKKAADVAFALEKGLSVAKIVVDTQAEIAGYYAANSLAGPAGIAIASSQALAAKIRAAASIATIAGTTVAKFMNGGSANTGSNAGSNSGGGGMAAPSPANFAFVQNQPNQQPPLQAYVVSTQVSSNLEAQQLINNQARLGG